MATPDTQSDSPPIRNCFVNAPDRRDILPVFALVLLAGLFAWLGSREKSLTTDEFVHILAGEAAWTLNDYRINPENGTLSGRISTSLLHLSGTAPRIEVDTRSWVHSQQWLVARNWWFQSGADHRAMLNQARLAMVAFNLIGLAAVFVISGNLWGRGGAYLSLFLAAFSPNFLGHMPLATSDFAGAWTLTLAIIAYVLLLEFPSTRTIMAAGLAAGFALTLKHSAVLIGPVALTLLVWRTWDSRDVPNAFFGPRREAASPLAKFTLLAISSLAAALVTILFIWVIYGWRFAAASPTAGQFNQFQIPWETIAHSGLSPIIGVFREWRILPEAFLYGLEFILSHGVRGSFLNGEYSEDGFTLYHLWTFIYKTPLPALLLHLAGITFILTLLFRQKFRIPPILRGLLVLGIFYSGMLVSAKVNIGYRHAFVILYISTLFAGILIKDLMPKHKGTALCVGILGLSMLPLAALQLDRGIAYVNFLGGGAHGGYRRIADSSLDWGQDLPAAIKTIERYQEQFPEQPAHLAYFGSADPLAYGLETSVAYLHGLGSWQRQAYVPALEPGLYIISATIMVPTREHWSRDLESAYLSLKGRSAPLYRKLLQAEDLHVKLATKILTLEELKTLNEFEYLRFQRLKTQLLTREPDDVLHGSILVYHVDSDVLDLF